MVSKRCLLGIERGDTRVRIIFKGLMHCDLAVDRRAQRVMICRNIINRHRCLRTEAWQAKTRSTM
ncbi:MAG: hypothetical protein DI632_00040 [Sphingomonas hengshuiensis]|uniref:Uncharacterized protein n=1 Tax=Sphingomonas hengshuiensis TaxID=1609977 RepID=A0A2W4ZI25_9SPHN|nr:MAG: hypothetical protein DI632_00040 [Sphingomonas hengshuiensis]